jgi:hypothetical protein
MMALSPPYRPILPMPTAPPPPSYRNF